MNFLSVIFLLVALSVHKKAEPCLIVQEKSITINGNTSIGSFSCAYETTGKSDTLFIENLANSPYSFTIPVDAFQCGNFLLNKDFQTTLKAKEYPIVSVQVISLKEAGNRTFTGSLKLDLVGKTKIMKDVCFNLTGHSQTKVLSADFIFHASEFQLAPPQKFGGLIKADDAMNVTVTLVLKPRLN